MEVEAAPSMSAGAAHDALGRELERQVIAQLLAWMGFELNKHLSVLSCHRSVMCNMSISIQSSREASKIKYGAHTF